jgi:hypothetical protein
VLWVGCFLSAGALSAFETLEVLWREGSWEEGVDFKFRELEADFKPSRLSVVLDDGVFSLRSATPALAFK